MKLNEVLFTEKLKKKTDGDTITLEFPFMLADEVNENKRRYSTSVLGAAVQEANAKLKSGRSLFGAPGHPKAEAEISDVSHLIEALWMQGKEAWARVKVIPTSAGRNLGIILSAGGKLGISARGVGTVTNRSGIDEVNSGYKLAAVDFVLSPSFGLHAGAENIVESTFSGESLMEESESDDENISEEELEEIVFKIADILSAAIKRGYGEEYSLQDFDDKRVLIAQSFEGTEKKSYFLSNWGISDEEEVSFDGLEPHDSDTLPEPEEKSPFPTPQEEEESLRLRYQSAVKAAYKGSFEDYKLLCENKDAPVRFVEAAKAGYRGTLTQYIEKVVKH